jgi:membrane-bound lytic murein transglycosylase D
MKFCLLLIALLMYAIPASATEPAHALLAELTRPSAPAVAAPESLALASTSEFLDAADQTAGPVPDLFTLEELKGKTGDMAELDLPDVDLPLSDIPLALNSKVEYFLYYFQTSGKQSFSRWLSRSSRYIPMMKEILKREGMPEDLVYVAMIESGFQMHARSWANAVGPWQFVSDTGRRYSLRIDQWIDERKDPVKATTAAALYLKELYGMFNGDWYLAAAGYNAGENKIMRAINKYNTSDFWEISRGSYLKRETKEYVPKLLAAAIIAKDPARYGFSDIAYLPAIEFETVKIPSRTDLELVAKLSGTTYETIRDLNPDLRHWSTPPNYPDYELKLPKGTKQLFELEYAKVPEDKRFTEKSLYTRYHAGKKDSLKAIARRFGTSPENLMELNSLSKKTRIAGKTLVVPVRQTVDFSHEGRSTLASAKKGQFAKYYTVRKGDTLDALSKRFNVSTKLLATWNNLKNKVALKPGRRIIIAKFSEKNGEMVPSGGKS